MAQLFKRILFSHVRSEVLLLLCRVLNTTSHIPLGAGESVRSSSSKADVSPPTSPPDLTGQQKCQFILLDKC